MKAVEFEEPHEEDAWREQGRQRFEAAYAPEDSVYEKLAEKRLTR